MENEPPIVYGKRWAAETVITPETVEDVAMDKRDLFKFVIDKLVDSMFDETGEPVDMKIEVKEIKEGDFDKNTFERLKPCWRLRIEGQKHGPGRHAIE